jgi:hypothetical protein
MASGLPVMAKGVARVVEIIEKSMSGLLVPPQKPWGAAEAVLLNREPGDP